MHIAEKVRFWEEQDRINQELIPRVIRQNELLTQHIVEHENLQQILSDTIQKALSEQARQYKSALDNAQQQLNETYENIIQKALSEQARQYELALDIAQQQLNETHEHITQKALSEQARQYELALDIAQQQLNETHEHITQKALSEQARQYELALDIAQQQLNKTYTKAIEAQHQEARQTQNRLTAIAIGSAIIAIAALIVAVLT